MNFLKRIRTSTHVAILCILSMLLLLSLIPINISRDGFVSPQAHILTKQAKHFYAKGGGSYSDFRKMIINADPIQYNDVRALWSRGRLTPQEVQRIL